jgi:Domain of unknown function (DUF4112)
LSDKALCHLNTQKMFLLFSKKPTNKDDNVHIDVDILDGKSSTAYDGLPEENGVSSVGNTKNADDKSRPGLLKKEKSIFQNLVPENTSPMPPLSASEQRAYDTIKRLQFLMDDCITLPKCFGSRKIGLDPLIGMIPGIGDFSSAAISLFIVARMSPVLSRYTIMRMLVNIWIDAVTGVFPLLGDVFDIGWKANQRNVAIFEDQMKVGGEARMCTDRRWVVMVVVGFFAFCFITTMITLGLCIAIIIILL